jgi:multidrug efflux pump subunit AcrB
MRYLKTAEAREHREAEWLEGLYRRILMPMINDPRKAAAVQAWSMWGALILMCAIFYTKWVAVKMLPLDNKPEFSVVLDMPEGTALPDTATWRTRSPSACAGMPEVTRCRSMSVRRGRSISTAWCGTTTCASPRGRPRSRSSCSQDGARPVQSRDRRRGARAGQRLLVAPAAGAHLRGRDAAWAARAAVGGGRGARTRCRDTTRQVAADLTAIFEQTENLRDVDNYMREPYDYWHFEVDPEGVSGSGSRSRRSTANSPWRSAEYVLGDVKQRAGHEPIHIVIQVPLAERSQTTGSATS